jgi:hypothetical protein
MKQRRANFASTVLALLCLALVDGCFGGSAQPPAAGGPPISDEEAIQFAGRADRFYRSLQGIPLAALITFEDPDRRQFFPTATAYADYYSGLATVARQNTLRDGAAQSVKIREFHFDGPDQVVVDYVVTGKHERKLRFWNIDFDRHDTWRRVDGTWVIVPDKL